MISCFKTSSSSPRASSSRTAEVPSGLPCRLYFSCATEKIVNCFCSNSLFHHFSTDYFRGKKNRVSFQPSMKIRMYVYVLPPHSLINFRPSGSTNVVGPSPNCTPDVQPLISSFCTGPSVCLSVAAA